MTFLRFPANFPVRGWLLFLLLNSARFAAHGQTASPPTTGPSFITTEVLGTEPHTRSLTAADLAALPRLTRRVADKAGKKHRYSGVALSEVLRLAGAPQGKALHGPVLAYGLFITGADGYQALFALPEIDPSFTSQTILLADQCDGQPLPPDHGVYQIIVPNDKRPARWVRQVAALRLGPVK